MPENKTKPTDKSIDGFLDTLANGDMRSDAESIIKMMKSISGEKPVLWGSSIIGFGAQTLHYNSGRKTDLPSISFAPRKNELVFYVLNNFKNQKNLLEKLGKHRTGKVCLYIKKLSDINREILDEIISSSYTKALKGNG